MTTTPKTKETIARCLEALQRPSKTLTNWEMGFLANVSDQFERRGTLTEPQFEALERIYAEKTA